MSVGHAMKPMSEAHFAILRRHMVEVIGIQVDLASEELGKAALDERVLAAMRNVPRHRFVPSFLAPLAYQDTPLPIGFDKTISQPFIVALMTDVLGPEPHESILEVGTGLGYQAAVLAELSGRVWSVEIVEELAGQAEANLRQLGCSDVAIRIGDGSRGWREHAPYDDGRRRAIASGDPRSNQTQRTDRSAAGPGRGAMAHGGRQKGGWTDQCSETDPGAVQPARDGRVRHSYPYRSAPSTANIRQERTGLSSTNTVQAPQTPCSQPRCVPSKSAQIPLRQPASDEDRVQVRTRLSAGGSGFELLVPRHDERSIQEISSRSCGRLRPDFRPVLYRMTVYHRPPRPTFTGMSYQECGRACR